MINFCTLFDSNYLDKALALYNSLVRTNAQFTLYILCFDDLAFDILADMKLNGVVAERLSDFETQELLAVKNTRTKAEYCWTCTAASIQHFIKKFNLSDCTYIDADMYFYSDPQPLFGEIEAAGAVTAIMEHRFNAEAEGKENYENKSGKYCVEFNYFSAAEESQRALEWWKERCIEWCYQKYEPATEDHVERYGDQKYLEHFPKAFGGVHVMKHMGAGVAPWNLRQYSLEDVKDGKITLTVKRTGESVPLVFYHFQNLKYINHKFININSQCKDKKLKRAIYYPYIAETTAIRQTLEEKYGLKLSIKKSYSSNKLKAFIQRNIMPYRLRNFSDLVRISKAVKKCGK